MSDADDHIAEADEYLLVAKRYLAKAEQVREEVTSGTVRGLEARIRFEMARDLAREHREMAEALRNSPVTTKVQVAAPTPADVDAMAAAITEQLAADTAAHQAVTLRPGVDDAPPEAGALWTFAEPDDCAGEWFWYALTDALENQPQRWLMVRHYAQVLRWYSEQGTKPIPHTWGEIGHDTDGTTVLRRPTAEERARFYGPEPDPAPSTGERWVTRPVPDGQGGLIDASAAQPAPHAWFPSDPTTMDAWLRGLEPGQLRRLHDEVARAIPVAEGRQRPRDERQSSRPGAEQWREG